LFALKGNYAGGFGGKKPEEVWAEKKTQGTSVTTPKPKPADAAPIGGSAIVRPVAK